jgi:EAL domain-containing protein (putative c-di-GMP-specific phosphodiesterase class I)
MLVYQPIIELDSDAVVGFEALLRWNHPTRGLVNPDAFIPAAEANGCIADIGRWVLDQACRTAAGWHVRHPDQALTMAVNLSTRQLARPEIVGHVRAALHDNGLAASQLVLEMTESVLVHDPVTVARRLHELRDLGVQLAIDDFGTGYSSLSYLRQFPVDILKVDQSFVHSITERDNLPAIVRGLLELGRTLGLEIIAEGIELPVQRDSLRGQHCRFGQGFLFSHPLREQEAGDLLERSSMREIV